ncbi:hypothetical protein [Flavobacterium sp.]|uniref:hypothetical protein n=1 Tax=Flavobacterium sp. TaxID=239 RepID=UPI00286E5CE4|nr:hypothetical protein [Flavobacterium sp.]
MSKTNLNIPAGWVGGFPPANMPNMVYPKRDLSSLPMLGNMDNINFLQRQLGVKWPEFSWETEKGAKDPKRCFQQFSPYISRIGYTNEGRIYSIICPQQGIWLEDEICLNVEITVTGQRGWVNESTKELAADMTVEGKIWFTPAEHQGLKLRGLLPLLPKGYPINKENAIRVLTHLPNDPNQPIFQVNKGLTPRFTNPDFAKHDNEAFTEGNIDVEIGGIRLINNSKIDKFNQFILDVFNTGSGNMLQKGNVLSWNLWFVEPTLVSIPEWKDHAKKWRDSIDAHHGSPTGEGTKARYFDGSYFNAKVFVIEEIIKYIKEHI